MTARAPVATHTIATLTPRQKEVAAGLAVGKTCKEIAAELGAAIKTIDTHRFHLLARLGLRNNAELAHAAIRAGLVELRP